MHQYFFLHIEPHYFPPKLVGYSTDNVLSVASCVREGQPEILVNLSVKEDNTLLIDKLSTSVSNSARAAAPFPVPGALDISRFGELVSRSSQFGEYPPPLPPSMLQSWLDLPKSCLVDQS